MKSPSSLFHKDACVGDLPPFSFWIRACALVPILWSTHHLFHSLLGPGCHSVKDLSSGRLGRLVFVAYIILPAFIELKFKRDVLRLQASRWILKPKAWCVNGAILGTSCRWRWGFGEFSWGLVKSHYPDNFFLFCRQYSACLGNYTYTSMLL